MIKSDASTTAGTGATGAQGQGQQSASQSAAVKSAMTLEVLQQLPNTVSVSFRGIRSYEIIDALSEKVQLTSNLAVRTDFLISCDLRILRFGTLL
jgi:hypothetical protein